MPYLGRKGASAPLTSADIPDNVIQQADIQDDAVTGAKLANDIAITTTGALTGTTGDFNWDSNTLVVDSSESRVGIGTASPGAMVEIKRTDSTDTRLLIHNSSTGDAVTHYTATADWWVGVDNSDGDSYKIANDDSFNANVRMTIDSSGKVGFGTSGALGDPLHVKSTGNDCRFTLESSTGKWAIGAEDGDKFGILNYGTSTPFIIDSTGNVGIGASSPSAVASTTRFLEIKSTSGSAGVELTASSGTNWSIYNGSGSLYHYNGSQRLTIATNGTFTGSGSADISDERLKENITTIPDALQKINALTGRTFKWKEEADMDSGVKYGLIAQELETVIPDLVSNKTGIRVFDKDGNLKRGATEPLDTDEWSKSIHMSGCIPILIEAVKELSAKVTALENA